MLSIVLRAGFKTACQLNTGSCSLESVQLMFVKANFHSPFLVCSKRNFLFPHQSQWDAQKLMLPIGDHVKRDFLQCLVAYSKVHLFLLWWLHAVGCHYPESWGYLKWKSRGITYIWPVISQALSSNLLLKKARLRGFLAEMKAELRTGWITKQRWGKGIPGGGSVIEDWRAPVTLGELKRWWSPINQVAEA